MQRNENAPGPERAKLIADLRSRVRQVQWIVKSMRSFRDSRAPGSAEHQSACSATLTAELTLRRMERHLDAIENAAQVEDFACEWIVQHGIMRGMPHGWDSEVR